MRLLKDRTDADKAATHKTAIPRDRTLKGHSSEMRTVAISSDSSLVVSFAHDRTMRVWDLESGRLKRVLKTNSEEAI